MPLFPMFTELAGRDVLVVGGGEVAVRKVEALLRAGARVRLNAPRLHPRIAAWVEEGRVVRLPGDFDPDWIDTAWLVVGATDDVAVNARLADEAHARYRLANIVDDATLSSFQVPAVVDRDPMIVAISSGGAAPMLARRMREQLESLFDASLGELAGLFARHRAAIRERLPDLAQRRRWFEALLDGPVPVLLQSGRRTEAEAAFDATLAGGAPADAQLGSVVLVGAGDGDPGLLTLKALRALNRVDLLLCDAAIGADIRALARRDTLHATLPTETAEALQQIIDAAGDGQRVVCLKPGDAFRQPPHDTWSQRLRDAGIACDVVAGVVGDRLLSPRS